MSRFLDEYTLQENIKQNSYVVKTDTGHDIGMTLGTIMRTIYETPTADVPKPVRCRECRWYRDGVFTKGTKFCYRLLDDERKPAGYLFPPDGYCSFAERKE